MKDLIKKADNLIDDFADQFWDTPANCEGNRSAQENDEHWYVKARNATSVSGEICKILGGLIGCLGAPVLLLLNPSVAGFSTAAGALTGGAVMAAVGSSATSNKKAASLAEITAWRSMQ